MELQIKNGHHGIIARQYQYSISVLWQVLVRILAVSSERYLRTLRENMTQRMRMKERRHNWQGNE